MAPTLLEIRGVSKTFRRSDRSTHQAVVKASLTVNEGETLALVGESGSGKSTLARLALRLGEPDAGEVRYRGKALGRMSRAELKEYRHAVQPIFQDPASSFNPRRRVRDALRQALRQAGASALTVEAKTNELVAHVRLLPAVYYLNRFPHELSGGQRQRLAIARALAMDPKLIIADEPLSGADASVRGQILNLLAELQRERNVAYLFITHDISVARVFAQRIAVMYRGLIIEEGRTPDVLDHPRHPYTQMLLACAPSLEHRVRLPTWSNAIQRSAEGGCSFYARCPFAVGECTERQPELISVGSDGHRAACLLGSSEKPQHADRSP